MFQKNTSRSRVKHTGLWKELAILCGFILLFQISAVGVFAWLSDASETVENIFASGKVTADIKETDTHDGDVDKNTNSYELEPGGEITKDPKITVPAGSADSWMFVKLEKSDNFDSYMRYDIADGWHALGNEYPNVLYRRVYKADEDQSYPVIAGNTVKVKDSVTKEMLNLMDKKPTLKITGYGIQQTPFDTAKEAWKQLQEEE